MHAFTNLQSHLRPYTSTYKLTRTDVRDVGIYSFMYKKKKNHEK